MDHSAGGSFFATANGFMPHGHCYLWLPEILWTHVLSDALIALSYFSIPLSILYFATKRPVRFSPLYPAFAVFILACGTGHLISIITVWNPIYDVEAVVKVVTAAASVVTAIIIWRIMPLALRIPSAAQLEESNEALRLANEKYDNLLNGIGMGVYEWRNPADPSSLYWTDRLYEIFDLDPKTFRPNFEDFFAMVHPEDRAVFREDIERTLCTGQGRSIEYRVFVRGQWRWFRSRRIAELDESGRALYVLGSIEDIHEIKGRAETLRLANVTLEEEVRRRTSEAEAANEAKSRFLANMSHEIRTPLGLILGFTELLASNPSLDEEARESVGLVVKNGEILSRVVNDLLDLSRVEAGKLKFLYSEFRLSDILAEIRTGFMERAHSKGLVFEVVDRTEGAPPLVSDEIRLKQIIYNLLSNALKFTEKGSIRLEARLAGEGGIEIDVSDTGIGIPDHERDGLFEAFSRGDMAEASRTVGTGLGLRLSRSLAHALGGDVQLLSSSETEGSVFRLRFRSHARRTPIESTTEVAGELKGLAIHVIDDNKDNLRLAQVFLEKLGCRVTAMTDPHVFIESVVHEQPDLVLLDILMPEMSGLDVFRHLRERGFKKDIWALTAYALNDDIQQILEHGFDGYIRKPISLNGIRRKLLQEFKERKDHAEA